MCTHSILLTSYQERIQYESRFRSHKKFNDSTLSRTLVLEQVLLDVVFLGSQRYIHINS